MTTMIAYLFELDALVYAPDIDIRSAKLEDHQICFMRQLFLVVLGAFPSFRLRWHDDSISANGQSNATDQFYPKFFTALMHECLCTSALQALGLEIFEHDPRQGRAGGQVLNHVVLGPGSRDFAARAFKSTL